MQSCGLLYYTLDRTRRPGRCALARRIRPVRTHSARSTRSARRHTETDMLCPSPFACGFVCLPRCRLLCGRALTDPVVRVCLDVTGKQPLSTSDSLSPDETLQLTASFGRQLLLLVVRPHITAATNPALALAVTRVRLSCRLSHLSLTLSRLLIGGASAAHVTASCVQNEA